MEFIVTVVFMAVAIATPFLVIAGLIASAMLIAAVKRERGTKPVHPRPHTPAPTYRDANCTSCGRPFKEHR